MKVFYYVLKKLVSEYKKQVIKCAAIMFIMSAIQLLIPLSMKKMISIMDDIPQVSVYIFCIILYCFLWGLYTYINVKWYKNIDILGEGALISVREKMYQKIWNCKYSDFYNYGINKLKNTFFTDVINVYANVIMYSFNIIAESVMIIILLVASAMINASMTIVLSIVVLFGFGLARYTKPKVVSYSREINVKMKKDNAVNNECLDAEELIRQNGLQKYYLEKIKNSVHEFIDTAVRTDQKSIFFQNVLNNYNQIAVLVVTGAIILTKIEQDSAFIVYYMYLTSLIIEKSQKIEDNLFRFMKNMASFDNIGEIISLKEVTNNGGKEIESINKIEFDDVSLEYNQQKKVIKNLSFEANLGDAILLKGINGSGKSSVLKMISGLVEPTSGSIKFNDITISEIDKNSLYKNICLLSQDELLLNENVHDYLEIISHRTISTNESDMYIEQVGLDKNFRTITDNGKSLSGGEKKKYLLLKLLALKEKVNVVLIDETEAGLDASSRNIMNEIEKYLLDNRDRYIVMKITHEKSVNSMQYNKELCLG